MLGYVLSRLSGLPQATFSESELSKRFTVEFEAAREEGLLRYVQTNLETVAYPCSSPFCEGSSRSIANIGEQLWALCNCSLMDSPVRLERADLRIWRLDLDKLCSAFRERNDVGGAMETLSDRLIYLGKTTRNGRSFGIVLGMLGPDQVRQNLTDLRRLVPDLYDSVVLLCPGFRPTQNLIRELESQLIILAGLDEEEPILITARAFGTAASSGMDGGQIQSSNLNHAESMRRALTGLSAGRKPGLGEAAFHLVRHRGYSNKQASAILQEVFFPNSVTVRAARTLHEYEIPGFVKDGQRRVNRGYPCRFC
ncbi:MAG: hypothetical protein GEU75_01010 [Dehalococcoidia bacterium]|nr:hypothetical protein [Dehalococcoidia bacterium]